MSNQIAVGRFGSPYGVKGWIKVISYTDPIIKILDYTPWFVQKGNNSFIFDKIKGKIHGNNLVVSLKDCNDRDVAKTFTNLEILIEKNQLPELPNEEYYWFELVGLKVVNCEQEQLGKIISLFNTGSNDVVVVEEESGKQRYIPYIKEVILAVDLAHKKMMVDWDATF